uniref:uncharacterized protein n=1 Tax=Centroberyx gerrardi TaxID=166262 RepID=UPI003AAB0664
MSVCVEREERPPPSGPSETSHDSTLEPMTFIKEPEPSRIYQQSRAESPAPSCLSVKSHDSMLNPLNFSSEPKPSSWRHHGGLSEDVMSRPRFFGIPSFFKTQRPESPAPSCLSVKSHDSMLDPLNFRKELKPSRDCQQSRAESPAPSFLSMKSDDSMLNPLNFKKEPKPSRPSMRNRLRQLLYEKRLETFCVSVVAEPNL